MKLSNQDIANLLTKTADLLEINGDNPYRIRAYRRAARRVDVLKDNIHELVEQSFDLTTIPFIGQGIAAQIKEILKTGKMPVLKNKTARKQFYNELKRVEGLGPKRIRLLNTQLSIYTREELLKAIESGQLGTLKGFTPALEKKIRASIENPKPYEKFYKLKLATLILDFLKEHLLQLDYVKEVFIAGDFRRKKELIGNVPILILLKKPAPFIEDFLQFDEVQEVIEQTLEQTTVILRSGMQVSMYVVTEETLASALVYHTGSALHLAELEKVAASNRLTFSSRGLFKADERVDIPDETAFYKVLKLAYIPPPLRENRGEIVASATKQLPKLVQLQDMKGDLHSHTNETDGTEPLENMVQATMRKGYEYFAITDHSQRLTITNGLNETRLRKQIEQIDELNSRLKGIRILKSIEVDILEDGSLDLPDHILKELDLRVCSLHSKFKLPEDKQTARVIRAMDNPYFNILGHPTGRLLQHRPPYAINIEKVLAAAKERGCFLELNAQPSRLDLDDQYCRLAKQMGVKLAISSDAHSIRELDFMQYGIYQAQRGWLEANDIINTRTWENLKMLLKRI